MEKISYVKQRNAVQQGIMGCKSIQVFKRKCRYSHHVWRFLMAMTWGTTIPEYAYYWMSVLGFALVISLFCQTRFKHRKAHQKQKVAKWENTLVYYAGG